MDINEKYTNPTRGILHFCKQKLAVPPLGSMTHLVHCLRSEQREEEGSETLANLKSPPPLREGPN